MKKLSMAITTAAVLGLGVVGIAPANAIRIDFDSVNGTDGQINQLDEGYILKGDEWSDLGLNISVDTNKNGSGNKNVADDKRLTVYDTDMNKSGKDNDLRTGAPWGTDPQGNILIIQETWEGNNWQTDANGNYKTPDDDRQGGKITFDFLEADKQYIYENLKVGLVDIDGPESAMITVFYTDEEGNHQQSNKTLKSQGHNTNPDITLLSNNEGENSMWEFMFDVEEEMKGLMSLDRLEIGYSGSGGVAYLEYDKIEKAIYGEEGNARVPEPSSALAMLALGAFGGGSILKRKQK
ncbi:MAG: PEP-CTERM sorting domain-containing protein [Microcoleaceae cyanobacterium]